MFAAIICFCFVLIDLINDYKNIYSGNMLVLGEGGGSVFESFYENSYF